MNKNVNTEKLKNENSDLFQLLKISLRIQCYNFGQNLLKCFRIPLIKIMYVLAEMHCQRELKKTYKYETQFLFSFSGFFFYRNESERINVMDIAFVRIVKAQRKRSWASKGTTCYCLRETGQFKNNTND